MYLFVSAKAFVTYDADLVMNEKALLYGSTVNYILSRFVKRLKVLLNKVISNVFIFTYFRLFKCIAAF